MFDSVLPVRLTLLAATALETAIPIGAFGVEARPVNPSVETVDRTVLFDGSSAGAVRSS